MGDPYIGEIRMFGGNFPPVGWAFCDGQLLSIAENETLFNLIGTTYGGDGQSTFGIPDLQGRVPIHQGTVSGVNFALAEKSGTESVTLTMNQMATHNHALLASLNAAGANVVTGNVTGQVGATQIYREVAPGSPLNTNAMTLTGGNQPHENRQPFLAVSYIISLFGIFPSQT